VAYKFKVERAGRPDAGWESGRNRALVLVPGAQRLERAFGSDPGAAPPLRTGRIDRLAPQPSAWVDAREVQVWLPPGYADAPETRYPVLYLHDGQNVFDAAAAGAEWQVDETAQRLVGRGEIGPMIIVAVASTAERTQDYTPVPHLLPGSGPVGGGAARYGRYLVQELKPLIDTRYRTRPERANTALGGSSFGGLVSMWLLLEHPATFGAALVVSPSVWWGDAAILDQVARQHIAAGEGPPRIWLDMGTGEGDAALHGARRLRDALRQRGWPVAYLEQAGAGHDEAAWAARVEPMLRFLYGVGAPAR
jgi:predicted alpha/beta superfamily hydrolase